MAAKKTETKVSKLGIKRQKGADGTLYATWAFGNKDVASYEVKWEYTTGNKYKSGKVVWFEGAINTVKIKQATYSIPSNATNVRVNVKPVAKTKTEKKKEVPLFNGKWTKAAVFYIATKTLPNVPPSPEVSITGLKLTTSIDNYVIAGGFATKIIFEVIQNDKSRVKTLTCGLTRGHAAGTYTVTAGKYYKVRARAQNKNGYSAWTDYTSNEYPYPAKISAKPTAKVYAEDALRFYWKKADGSTGYEVQYCDDKTKFDRSGDVQSDRQDLTTLNRIISGLAPGITWYFRVRGYNDSGDGGWSPIGSVILGSKPSPPTTWTYMSIAKPTEAIRLNWTHNSEDGSDQKYRRVHVEVVRGDVATPTIYENSTLNQYIVINNSTYPTNPAPLQDGDVINWKVATKGVYNAWSDYSTVRTIRIHAAPSLGISIASADTSGDVPVVSQYPLEVSLAAGPASQSVLSMTVSIAADSYYYEDMDNGESRAVSPGDVIFTKNIDNPESNTVTLSLTPGDVHLEPEQSYILTATVGMNTGLSVTKKYAFKASFDEDPYVPMAEIFINDETLSASIRPYCADDYGNPTNEEGTMNVYRREYDGTFTPIETGILIKDRVTVVDPHPSLDFARYRITARNAQTGQISYNDMPGVPTGETAVIIQWDEVWRTFDVNDSPDEEDEPQWSGHMLRLPYNIDVSDNFDQDVELVEYIGREYPVSYYGTQKGHTSTWKVDIRKTDADTLYLIRRLARYSGDVYVREPSGTGYWAQIKVSYSLTHKNPTVPVTFNITHVDGPTPDDTVNITVPSEDEEEAVETNA